MARDLRLNIDGDSRDAERALKRTEEAVEDVADEVKGLAGTMVPYVSGAKKAEHGTEKFGDELRELARDAKKAERAVDGLTAAQRRAARVPQLGGGGRGPGSGLQFQALPFNPIIAGGALASVGAAAPFLGGVTGAAGILGAGGLAAAGGAAITASRNDDVQGSFANFGQKVAGRATVSADAAFAKPMIQAAATLSKAFDRISDDMDRIFEKSAKFIDPLTRGLSGFVERMLPGFEKALDAGGKLFDTFGDQLPQLGDAVGDMFESFAGGSEGANEALGDLLEGTGALLRGFGNLVEGLSDLYDQAVKFRELNPITSIIFGDMNEGEAMSIGAAAEDSLDQIAGASTRAAKETKRLNDEFDKLFGRIMTTHQAAIEYEQAIDDLTASFRENGNTIDITTEKGRANLEAINDVIGAIEEQRDAAISAGDGSRAATDAANAAYIVQLGNLRQQLKALGQNTAAVDALIAKYEALGRPVTKTLNLKVIVSDPTNALGGRASSGQVRFFAEGGRYEKGQPRVVGEKGPEFDIPDSSGFVATEASVRQMLRAGGGTVGGMSGRATAVQPVRIEFGGDRGILDMLRKLVRDYGGGDVQVAFGRSN